MKPELTYPITSKQVAFDYVWHHFIVEKNPPAVSSNNGWGWCVYDSLTGGCAVGCLLPPHKRTGLPIDTVDRVWDCISDQFGGDVGVDFLESLQQAHDAAALGFIGHEYVHREDRHNGSFHDQFRLNLMDVLSKHGLVVPQ